MTEIAKKSNCIKIIKVVLLIFVFLSFQILIYKYEQSEWLWARVKLYLPDTSTPTPTSPPDQYFVPDIVHFLWFGENRTLTFINYVSVRSAYKIHVPSVIMFHYDHLPLGPWWNRLMQDVPLQLIHRRKPTLIHGQRIGHIYHQGDVAKLEVLLEYGGIYLDYDVIVVSPLHYFRRFNTSLGREREQKFIAGIIISAKDSTFLKAWYESYRNNYRPNEWDYNCAREPFKIYLKHPDWLHVEWSRFTIPDWEDRNLLFDIAINWRDLYVVHLMIHGDNRRLFEPDDFKHLDNTFGQVIRYVYFGTSDIVE